MGLRVVIETVAPVFCLIGVGFLMGSFRKIDLATLTDVVVYIAGPSLIFTALARGSLDAREGGLLVAGAAAIVLGVGGLVLVGSTLARTRPGALYLPAMFMNAGNMLLPLSLFAFGEDGLQRSAVIFVTVAVLHTTLGVTIASGRWTVWEMFRLPYVYAVAAALGARAGVLTIPSVLDRAVGLLGDMAIPLMLLALGLRLRSVTMAAWWRPALAATARIAGGYAVALAFVTFFGVNGLSRSCLLLAAVMPSAVVNFVFAEKYDNEASGVATAIVFSTVVSLVTTPLVLAFGL